MTPPQDDRPTTLTHLATLSPPCNSRTWQSAPHPSAPIIATACSDRSVRVYSLTSFTLLHTVSGGHKRSVRTVGWKPHTRGQSVLATGSFDATVGIWRRDEEGLESDMGRGDAGDDDDYQFACILEGHESEVKCLAWSPSGQYIATCSRDKSVWVWEELEDDNFETVAVLSEHDQDVKCVAWHPEEDLLASASYDDTVRLYREDSDDWVQVCSLDGHDQTVWWVEFEGSEMWKRDFRAVREGLSEVQTQHVEMLEKAGPRLATCSDDCTVRIWRRVPRQSQGLTSTGMPSIIRSFAIDEDWVLDAVLSKQHDRAIYSVAWSKKSGLLASAGSDGKIIVYRERWKNQISNDPQTEGEAATDSQTTEKVTEWEVVAEVFSAHDVFEINHVTWAARVDTGKKRDDEEILISTGDDGEVRVWTLE